MAEQLIPSSARLPPQNLTAERSLLGCLLLENNAMDEVAQRVAVVKTKKPEDFVETRFLKELEKEGFFKQFQKKS